MRECTKTTHFEHEVDVRIGRVQPAGDGSERLHLDMFAPGFTPVSPSPCSVAGLQVPCRVSLAQWSIGHSTTLAVAVAVARHQVAEREHKYTIATGQCWVTIPSCTQAKVP